jgi:Squalene/phytoene synthase.
MSDKNYLSIYAKSFNWAGFFLPRKIYLKCSDLYNFCRTVDNIADNQDKIETKKKNLTDVKNNFNNKNDNDSNVKNMWSLINEHEIQQK